MDPDASEFLALGPLAVRRAGRQVDLGSPKQRAVLGVLLLAAPDAVSVSRLVDEVWPERPPRDPLRSLQVYVSSLRRALGEGRLVTEGRAYRLDLPPDGYDVARFEAAVAESARLAAAAEHEALVRVADEGLALWRGEAWQDQRTVPGIGPAATRLEEQKVDLLARRAASLLALGRHRDVVPELEMLVARHPLHESMRGHLMVALHRCGRQSDALATYAEGRAHKVAETGLEPGETLRKLHARVLADDPALVVEDAELRARRHLPAPATALIGRRREVDEVAGLLRGDARLLSLCGPGGIGKTRVALQAAHELADTAPDGVWFVGLAALSDPALVPQAIAEALDVDGVGGDFEAALVAHLAPRRLVLLLDNFEQLVDAAPVVSRLLEAAPELRVLTTSRMPLRLYGENVRALDPLDVDEAVPLFRDRARRADHRFDASHDEVVRQVCDALDRLPLAIELVAARGSELTLAQMRDQLHDRLDLAAEGPRDRTVRQQTLRGAVRWSVDLLDGEDAAAFAVLAIFVGGFDEQAAAALDVGRDRLLRLARASLLTERDDRFEMLQTVRDVAGELLLEVDADGRAADAHAAYFARLGAELAEGLRGPDAASWVRRRHPERGNLRAALARLEATAQRDDPPGTRLVRLAADLSFFWYRTSPASGDVGWLERALAAGPDTEPSLRGRALHGLAICRAEQGLAEEALAASKESNRLFREAGDERWLARAMNTLGGLHRDLGRTGEALPLLEECVALRRRLDDSALPTGIALGNRAMLALDVGDIDTARRCLAECLVLADGPDDVQAPLTQALLADVELAAGNADEARRLLGLAVPALREHGMDYRLIECLDTYAALAVHDGRLAEAATLVAAADRALAEDGAVQVPADAALRERRIGRALARLDSGSRAAAEVAGSGLDLDEALRWASELLL